MIKSFCFIGLILILSNCGLDSSEEKNKESNKRVFSTGHGHKLIQLSHNIEDQPTNDYLKETLEPIRANFKRINSTDEWTKITERDLKESTEGGVAYFFYNDQKLEKIIERRFGETGQVLREYYLMDGELSFVFEKDMHYNRPIYWDEEHKKENNDSEVFDYEKSEVTEERSYFKEGKLIHQIVSEDCGAPFAESYLQEEEQRILEAYNDLLKLEK